MIDVAAKSRAEAERLLEGMFKAGAQHFYIFDRMKCEPETGKVLAASPAVNAELLSVLLALVIEIASASAKTAHENGARLAQELIPGLKGWKAPRSDWLDSESSGFRYSLRLCCCDEGQHGLTIL